LALIGLIVAVAVLIKKMKELQPKVQAISDRIDRIGERVERISETVEGIAGSAKGTIDNVAGGANSLIKSLSAISSKVEGGLGKFAPILVAIKLAQAAFAVFSDRKKAKTGTDNRPLPAKIKASGD
jgi:uncharacterized protein YoxC